jgi:hypothetical protein
MAVDVSLASSSKQSCIQSRDLRSSAAVSHRFFPCDFQRAAVAASSCHPNLDNARTIEQRNFFILLFWDKVWLCSPGWLWTLDSPASVSRVLGFQVCTTMPSFKNYYYYFGSTASWTQRLPLARQDLYRLRHVPSPFFFSLFLHRVSHFLPRASLQHLHTYTSCIPHITDVNHHAWVIYWDGVSLTFCVGWPWTLIILISASWVVGITGVSHHISIIYLLIFILWCWGANPGPHEC